MILTGKLSLMEYVVHVHKEPFVLVYIAYNEHMSDKYEDEFRPAWTQKQYLELPDTVCVIVLDIAESEAVYANLCTDERTQIRATPSWIFYCYGQVMNQVTLSPYFEEQTLLAFLDACMETVLHPPPHPMALGQRTILRRRWTPDELHEAMQSTVGYMLLYFSYGAPDVSHLGKLAMSYCANLPAEVQVVVVDAKLDAEVFQQYRAATGLTNVPMFRLYKTRAVPLVSARGGTETEPVHDPVFVMGFSARHTAEDESDLYKFICEVELKVLDAPNTVQGTWHKEHNEQATPATLSDVLSHPDGVEATVKYQLIDAYLEDMAFNMSLATFTRHRSSIRRILGSHDLKTLERCCSADTRPEKKDTYIALFQEWARANYRMVYGKQVLPASWPSSPGKEGDVPSEPVSPTSATAVTVPTIAEGGGDGEDDDEDENQVPQNSVKAKPQRRRHDGVTFAVM